MTIPQTNLKIGYFLTDTYTISFGLDHMKYVMNDNEYRTIDGYIDLPVSEEGSIYNGVYNVIDCICMHHTHIQLQTGAPHVKASPTIYGHCSMS